MHIVLITILFNRRAAYIKGCYFEHIMVGCLGKIPHYALREMMCNCERHVFHVYIYDVLFIKEKISKRHCRIACATGFIFNIDVD